MTDVAALPDSVPVAHATGARDCRNCGTPIDASDDYCRHCGQETQVGLPTARQFMREAAGRYVALDGRLWRTARGLVRPGFLTREYIAGRRRRYVRPGRLFLVTSIVAFTVIRIATHPHVAEFESERAAAQRSAVATKGAGSAAKDAARAPASAQKTPAANGTSGTADSPKASVAADNASRTSAPPDASATPKSSDVSKAGESSEAGESSKADETPKAGATATRGIVQMRPDDQDDAVLLRGDGFNLSFDNDLNLRVDGVGPGPSALRERVNHFNRLPLPEKGDQLAATAFRYGPYAAIALLPAFALMLKLVYLFTTRRYAARPRRFAAHLVFAAHNHAFLFVMATLLVLPWPGFVMALVPFGAAYYLLRSMRVVYGGGWAMTLMRAFVLFVLYAIAFALVTVSLLAAAVLLQ